MKLLCPKLAKVLGYSAIVMLLIGLAFRFAVYRHMYIGPDDAHGLSDVIELFLGVALMVVLGTSVVAVLALALQGRRENRIAAAWLAATCALIVMLVEPLHALAARWAP